MKRNGEEIWKKSNFLYEKSVALPFNYKTVKYMKTKKNNPPDKHGKSKNSVSNS